MLKLTYEDYRKWCDENPQDWRQGVWPKWVWVEESTQNDALEGHYNQWAIGHPISMPSIIAFFEALNSEEEAAIEALGEGYFA